jgi:putative hydrolase of the HAD superfamily
MDKIKAILLDADGLLLKRQKYFSEIFSEQYNIPAESIIPFFKTKFRDCQRGTADVKEELVPFLKKWKWSGTVENFLDYWFASCTEVDEEVLKIMQEIRKKNIKCYLSADQEKYRGEYIKNNLGLEKNLDGFFFSYELGYSKSEKEFFEKILEKLNLQPSEVIFLDDEAENVEVAKKLGILAFTVSGAEDFRKLVISDWRRK